MDDRDNMDLSTYLQDFIDREDELMIDMAYVVRRLKRLESNQRPEPLLKQKQNWPRGAVQEQVRTILRAVAMNPGILRHQLKEMYHKEWPDSLPGAKTDFFAMRFNRALRYRDHGMTIGIAGDPHNGYELDGGENEVARYREQVLR